MKAVKVQYTVKSDFVDQNKANIRKVIEALRSKPIHGMLYCSLDEETLSKISDVKEFGELRAALEASGPVSPPTSENLNLVDAGFVL